MPKSYEREIGGRPLAIEVGKLAGQANGAATVRYGDTVVLVTACVSSQLREGVDFLPLTIDYEERLYAAGKIPGGWFRREGRPSAEAVLADHEVNEVRRELGENPATGIWLWGSGRPPRMPRFRERFGLTGAAIAAVDLVRGIAVCLGWRLNDVPGATGYLDTNYDAKGRAAVEALDACDLVAIHVQAPDEAGESIGDDVPEHVARHDHTVSFRVLGEPHHLGVDVRGA